MIFSYTFMVIDSVWYADRNLYAKSISSPEKRSDLRKDCGAKPTEILSPFGDCTSEVQNPLGRKKTLVNHNIFISFYF